MRMKIVLAALMVTSVCSSIFGCGSDSKTSATTAAHTTEAVTAAETSGVSSTAAATVARFDWETVAEEDIDSSIYKMTGGTWFYQGVEDEISVDMDGLKGFTTYTVEAIPETDGYLRYLGTNQDGFHVFDVYDIYGRQCMVLTFISDEQFYIDDDETNYYVKWDY